MKLEGMITIDMGEIKRAVADYVNKGYQLKVDPETVRIYPTGDLTITACVNVPVQVTNGHHQGEAT